MRNLNCLVVDDEPMAQSVIESYISKLDFLTHIGSSRNAIEALNKIKSSQIDLIFLDIQMPQMTGIDLIKILKHPPKIILTTAYKEFALDGYELDVVDYLLKPISFERFMKAVDKAMGRIETQTEKTPDIVQNNASYIFIKSDKQMKKVFIDDILFIEGLKEYIQIVTKKENIVSYLSLKYMQAKLPEVSFLRVHRSYIINVNNIDSYNSSEIDVDQHKIPIGRYYKKLVQDFLENESD